MKRTRTVALVASVLVGIAFALPAESAEPKDESPQEMIVRLKREGAELRMQLNAARRSAERAKTEKAAALARASQADDAQDAFAKQIANLQNTVKMLTAQNIELQGLVKAEGAAKSTDKKVSDAYAQLVQALQTATKLRGENGLLVDQGKTLDTRVKKMEKATAAARRELAVAKAALRDIRQELAIEKGKHITGTPATNTTPKPKPVVSVITPKPKPKPKPALKIATSIRAVSDNLASVNVGSSVGVEVGMKLLITRGPDYVATLVISDVTKSQAAGSLVDVKIPPRAGDTVTNMP